MVREDERMYPSVQWVERGRNLLFPVRGEVRSVERKKDGEEIDALASQLQLSLLVKKVGIGGNSRRRVPQGRYEMRGVKYRVADIVEE